MKKTIGVDIRALASGKRTGVEEYVINLLSKILVLDKSIRFKLFYNGRRKAKLDFDWLELDNVQLYDFKIPNRFVFNPSISIFNAPKIDDLIGGVDAFLNPHLFSPISLSDKCKYVAVIHDLGFFHFPEFLPIDKMAWHKIETRPLRQVQRANKIVVSSESTKKDVEEIYKSESDKVEVVYPGLNFIVPEKIDSEKVLRVKQTYDLPDEYILYLGTIEPRKNILGLIKAFEEFKKQKNEIKLVIAGSSGWLCENIYRYVKDSPISKDIIFTGFIDPDDKFYLYHLAKAFVYPSFFEGFGFPVLEAMASGIPTITSNTSSLPEVGGHGCLIIDPFKPKQIAEAINSIVSDDKLRQSLIRAGKKQAGKFNWSKTAEQILNILVA